MSIRHPLGCALLAALPAGLWAQSGPVETSRQEPAAETDEGEDREPSDRDAARESEPRVRWRLRMGLAESWESNPLLLEGQDADSLAHRVESGLTRVQRGRRSEFAVVAGASVLRYPALAQLDRLDYGAGLSASRRMSGRLTIRLAEAFTSSHAHNAGVVPGTGSERTSNTTALSPPMLSGERLLLPATRTLAHHAQGDVTARIGFRGTVSATAQHALTRFESPELVDGSAFDLNVAFHHRITSRDTLGGFYSFQMSRAAGIEQPIHVSGVVGRRRIGPRGEAGAALGLTVLPAQAAGSARRHLYASMELSGELGKAMIGGRYRRTVEQRFGFGRALLGDVASARIEWNPNRRLNLLASYGYAFNRDPRARDFRYTVHSVLGRLGWRLVRQVELACGFTHGRSTAAGPVSATRNEAVSLSLIYDASP